MILLSSPPPSSPVRSIGLVRWGATVETLRRQRVTWSTVNGKWRKQRRNLFRAWCTL